MNPIKNNIISSLNLDNLPEKEQEEIIIRIGSIIYQNVLIRVMETTADKEQDEFEKLLDNNAKPEEIFSFLKNNVKDFEKIVNEEAEKFKDKASVMMSEIER